VTGRRLLSAVAGVSFAYDLATGVALLVATNQVAAWFGAPLPTPILFVKLNAVFLIAVGLGYLAPMRHPDAHRGYLWIFGPLLKGGGALTFLIDHYVNGSPASFLLFAASDGALALATLAALIVSRRS
jgi:hypothetical protein